MLAPYRPSRPPPKSVGGIIHGNKTLSSETLVLVGAKGKFFCPKTYLFGRLIPCWVLEWLLPQPKRTPPVTACTAVARRGSPVPGLTSKEPKCEHEYRKHGRGK